MAHARGGVPKNTRTAAAPWQRNRACLLTLHHGGGVACSGVRRTADVALHEARGARPRGARETPASAGSTCQATPPSARHARLPCLPSRPPGCPPGRPPGCLPDLSIWMSMIERDPHILHTLAPRTCGKALQVASVGAPELATGLACGSSDSGHQDEGGFKRVHQDHQTNSARI